MLSVRYQQSFFEIHNQRCVLFSSTNRDNASTYLRQFRVIWIEVEHGITLWSRLQTMPCWINLHQLTYRIGLSTLRFIHEHIRFLLSCTPSLHIESSSCIVVIVQQVSNPIAEDLSWIDSTDIQGRLKLCGKAFLGPAMLKSQNQQNDKQALLHCRLNNMKEWRIEQPFISINTRYIIITNDITWFLPRKMTRSIQFVL